MKEFEKVFDGPFDDERIEADRMFDEMEKDRTVMMHMLGCAAGKISDATDINTTLKTYFFVDAMAKLVKIGRSVNIENRMKNVSAGRHLELAGFVDGDFEMEFHKKFDQLRTTGEWFLFQPPLSDFLLQRFSYKIPDVEKSLPPRLPKNRAPFTGRPPKHTSIFLSRNRERLAYAWVTAAKRAALFLHNNPVDHQMWLKTFAELGERCGFNKRATSEVAAKFVLANTIHCEIVSALKPGVATRKNLITLFYERYSEDQIDRALSAMVKHGVVTKASRTIEGTHYMLCDDWKDSPKTKEGK